MTRTRSALFLALGAVLFATLSVPFLSHAQTTSGDTELRATIKTALLSDPRTAGMSEAQLNAMVDVLTAAAQKKGVTSHDITWRPVDPSTFDQQNQAAFGSCDSGTFLCSFNRAFGFSDSSPLIPIMLGAVSAMLLFVIGMLLHHQGHHVTGTLTT